MYYQVFIDRPYLNCASKGVEKGQWQEFTGGGLLRNVGEWAALNALRKGKDWDKSDERILGDSDFVNIVANYQINWCKILNYLNLYREYIFPVKASQVGVKRLSQGKCIVGLEVIYFGIFRFNYSGA